MNAAARRAALAAPVPAAASPRSRSRRRAIPRRAVARPDVPAGPAAVVGRLVHETRPDAVANVDVLLYALSRTAARGCARAAPTPRGASASRASRTRPT